MMFLVKEGYTLYLNGESFVILKGKHLKLLETIKHMYTLYKSYM